MSRETAISQSQPSAHVELIPELHAVRQELAAGQFSSGSVDDFLWAFEITQHPENGKDALLLLNLGDHDDVY